MNLLQLQQWFLHWYIYSSNALYCTLWTIPSTPPISLDVLILAWVHTLYSSAIDHKISIYKTLGTIDRLSKASFCRRFVKPILVVLGRQESWAWPDVRGERRDSLVTAATPTTATVCVLNDMCLYQNHGTVKFV